MKKLFFSLIFTATGAMLSMAANSILGLSNQFTDETIIPPGSLETDVHKMMENWYLRNYIEMDRNADASADSDVSDELIMKRLSTMPTTIEMPYNSVVRSYIDMYTQKRRQLIENMLGMSLYYMPIFEEALEREGLPLELKYLPIIESALNPDAVSRAGAAGLWQFMVPTAKSMGLEINSLIDERRDPYKSSDLAAKYLKQLYGIFGDWSLAIAAYNCGPGNVTKAFKRAGGNSDKTQDFWTIYDYLPKETRGYVPCFIAANYVMTYYPEHNISPALAKRPLITDSVHVTKRIHLQQIADVLSIPVEEIRILNPQFRQDWIPGDIKPYNLVLPSKQIYSYILSEDSIVNHNLALYERRMVAEPGMTTREDGDYIITEKVQWHKVKRGETLTSIARRYGVTVSSLKTANNGISGVKRGQTIKIVTTQKVKKPVEETVTATQAAQQDSTNVENTELLAQNASEGLTEDPERDLQADSIAMAEQEARQKLLEEEAKRAEAEKPKVTPKTTKKQDNSSPVTITVKKGDSLYSIAKRNGTTVAKLKQLNGLKSDKIQAGQKLRVR